MTDQDFRVTQQSYSCTMLSPSLEDTQLLLILQERDLQPRSVLAPESESLDQLPKSEPLLPQMEGEISPNPSTIHGGRFTE